MPLGRLMEGAGKRRRRSPSLRPSKLKNGPSSSSSFAVLATEAPLVAGLSLVGFRLATVLGIIDVVVVAGCLAGALVEGACMPPPPPEPRAAAAELFLGLGKTENKECVISDA